MPQVLALLIFITASQTAPITTLIKTTIGQECTHNLAHIPCVALDETAAEKWVALTRRIANTQEKTRDSDKHLVRHIYDLHQLHTKNLLTGEYKNLVRTIIEKDVSLFKKHNSEYVKNPIQSSQQALAVLADDPQWKQHWKDFCNHMVYENQKPDFFEALDRLQFMSQEIF